MAKKIKIRLFAVDMSKAKGHEHPDISEDKEYLILFDGSLYVGTFSRQWYGWNFNGVYDAGAQFDEPGTNASSWQQIWEIRRYKDE